MGVVYAAHDFALDRRVSLKLVRSGRGPDAEQRRARLLSEAQALARVAHPNVVAVHDVGTFGDEVYVALEHVPGLTLGDWLRTAPRSPRAVCEVFAQAGRGLAAVHAAGLVHRDVKPDNVLLGEDGRVRLADFGLAVAAGGDGDATAGTPGYMPLEQLRGEPVDARADQFAFAVALFEALTGERPYGPRGASRAVLLERLERGVPADVPRLPGVSSALRRALARALSPASENRFASLDPLLQALERRGPDRRKASVPVGLSVLSLIFVALIAASAMPPGGRAPPGIEPRATPSGVPVEPSLARDRERPKTARPQAAEARSEPAPVPSTAGVRAALGGSELPAPEPTRSPGARADGWGRRPGPGFTPRRDPGAPLLPEASAALEALVESLQGLVKSLRAALEGDSHTTWVGGPALASAPLPEGARNGLSAMSGAATGGGEPVQADGSGLRTAAIGQLEQRLTDSLARGVPTDIAEARFALAQGLASDPSQRARALALAEQAQQDLDVAGSPDARTEALRTRVQDWIEAHKNFPRTGGGGGQLVQTGEEDPRRLTSP
jgi:hypothetical protein